MGAFAPIRVIAQAGTDDYVHDNGRAYTTITAALAAALSGDLVLLGPGTYNGQITIPNGVQVRGTSLGAVIIQSLNVVANTDLVTMGENSRLEDVTLKLTSAGHFTLKGVTFPGTTSATAKLRTSVLTVDNSGAAGAGTSNVYGVHSYGTGAPSSSTDAVRATTIQVFSAGLGNKRGLLLDTAAHSFRARDCNFRVTNAGGAGSYVGIETAFATAVFVGRVLSVDGATSDLLPTSGPADMTVGPADLATSTSGGLAFMSVLQSALLVFADSGGLPSGATRYMRPGTDPVSATEIKLKFTQKTVVQRLQVRAVAGPGAARTDVFTVRKNGVDTTLTASLVAAATSVSDTTHAVTYAAGDDFSLKVVTAAGSGTSDVIVTVEHF